MSLLDAAAQVLRCYGADCTDLTVTELVTRLGMPKSNASRLLRAMRDAGLLENVGASKRYRPGLLLVDAARVYLRASSLIARADAMLARIVADCGHTGHIALREGREVTAITDHPGTKALRVASSIGTLLAAFASATGRSLLARLPEAEVRALYAAGFAPPSPSAPQDMADLLRRLEEVRRRAYATANDEASRGIGAVAVAIVDPRDGQAVSLCIAYPAATTDAAERRSLLAALLDGAAEIAALVGDATHAVRPRAG
ncbi:IclR family transcriptional regulator [Falsiroseomonas selenitidurans]|uniref:Helix-turn-helix domain-containing protein n=1 Tax=Falsiroseomonas selenitidurans TaxID=2716335 RepID=A0ABX1E777_9PROT|nr:IclR family transcriptional regulator C-terminal domain-containing protein [Falsiroseomonas selenitidurans]NKC32921.1 helix-turn-helix domain-containing protein [Falsiroseomonas selenitidurans]